MADTLAHFVLGAPAEKALPKDSRQWDLHRPAQEIDAKDEGTPDSWIPRHHSLLRLTGRHPLNCQPPMDKLMDAEFITPVSLHFVRNHGAVPKLNWNSHRVEITGLVDRPKSLTMDEILKFPSVTIPVTLTCSGNRRKEANLTKKTVGFNWGPGATACSHWTGVRLSDILRYAGTKGPNDGAHHVCFRGPKGELPKGDDGSYGTSVSWSHAMDPANDVILAYKQNGRWLAPDHGFPIRLIVPGCIAGRMVKWLSEITVTHAESNNFYHYHDNRLLPSHVDEALANKEGWWYKPEYAIYELNINSAVARPRHDETLSLSKNKPYTVKGYAYTGGGRKVIRVEVSLDSGKFWQQAEIDRVGPDSIHGKSWAWVFWRLQLQSFDLLNTDELLVRAVDSSQNIQPDKLTWNLMGMLNNSHFKVVIQKQLNDDGEICLRFQHPAPAEVGRLGNVGWIEEKAKATPQTPLPRPPVSLPPLIIEEPKTTHAIKESKTSPVTPVGTPRPSTPSDEALVALDPKKKIPFPLSEKIVLNHNTRLFRFALPSPQHRLGLPVGKHMFLYADIGGEPCMRAYTPTSSDDDLGHFDLVVKVYRANEHPKFPEGGKMSQFLDAMKIGDTIDVKGPIGHFTYVGRGNYVNNRRPGSAQQLTMIAGGTGITPVYQVIKAILKDPSDRTQIKLLYANRTESDILLRDELDTLARQHPNFDVWYTLNVPPTKWEYSTGHINLETLKSSTFPASQDGQVLMCGPKPMIDFACTPNLEKMGWEKSQMVEF